MSEIIAKAEKVAKILEKVKSKQRPVGFTVKVNQFGDRFEVVVECGVDYPDRIADKVFDACEKAGLSSREFSCVAEQSGGTDIRTIYVNGGKSNRRWR